MRLQNLHKLFSLKRVCKIIAKRDGIKITEKQVHLLYLFTVIYGEINTNKIRAKMDWLAMPLSSRSTRYNLGKLLEYGLVTKKIISTTQHPTLNGGKHVWTITPDGMILLENIETQIRKMRPDK